MQNKRYIIIGIIILIGVSCLIIGLRRYASVHRTGGLHDTAGAVAGLDESYWPAYFNCLRYMTSAEWVSGTVEWSEVAAEARSEESEDICYAEGIGYISQSTEQMGHLPSTSSADSARSHTR